MTCRAPDTTTTCAGTATGAQLGYDTEGRLASWQNAPTTPTTTDSFLYDGAGNRVEQSVTVNGSITTTITMTRQSVSNFMVCVQPEPRSMTSDATNLYCG
jgi:YD repeat-containing protein